MEGLPGIAGLIHYNKGPFKMKDVGKVTVPEVSVIMNREVRMILCWKKPSVMGYRQPRDTRGPKIRFATESS